MSKRVFSSYLPRIKVVLPGVAYFCLVLAFYLGAGNLFWPAITALVIGIAILLFVFFDDR